MGNSQEEAKRATACGYWQMYRFNPELREAGKNPFTLDSKEPTADFKEFLMGEVRYSSLAKAFPEAADALFEKTEKDAMERLEGYKKLANQQQYLKQLNLRNKKRSHYGGFFFDE